MKESESLKYGLGSIGVILIGFTILLVIGTYHIGEVYMGAAHNVTRYQNFLRANNLTDSSLGKVVWGCYMLNAFLVNIIAFVIALNGIVSLAIGLTILGVVWSLRDRVSASASKILFYAWVVVLSAIIAYSVWKWFL